MSNLFWLGAYVGLLLIHYPGLAYAFGILIPNLLGIEGIVTKITIWMVTWLSTGLIFNGCILTYAEQYCKVQAGLIKEISYNFTDSLAYQFVFRFFVTETKSSLWY